MCCTRLAENTGSKKLPKIRHLGTIAQLSEQYLPHMSPQYGELRTTNG